MVDGKAQIGIIPLKNSYAGAVVSAQIALKKYSRLINKIEEFDVKVHHCLLGLKNGNPDDITQIVSHPQGIKQCRQYIDTHFPKTKVVEYANTALAAKDLASGKLPKTTAVIASRRAAQIFKLRVLASDIQDSKSNGTTFLVFSKKD